MNSQTMVKIHHFLNLILQNIWRLQSIDRINLVFIFKLLSLHPQNSVIINVSFS